MNLSETVCGLRAAGVRALTADLARGSIRFEAPPGAVSPELRAALAEHKAALLDLARSRVRQHRPPRFVAAVAPTPPPPMVGYTAEECDTWLAAHGLHPVPEVAEANIAALQQRLCAVNPRLSASGWIAAEDGAGYRLTHADGRRTGLYISLEAAVRAAQPEIDAAA